MDLNFTRTVRTSKYGNGLFANINFDPGDVVIRIQSPFLSVVENQALDRICASCFVEAGEDVTLQSCTECGVLSFCSITCQKAVLEPGGSHRRECYLHKTRKQYQNAQARTDVSEDIIPTVVRATMLLLDRQAAEPDNHLAFMSLSSHQYQIKETQPAKWDDIQIQAQAAANFSGKEVYRRSAIETLCRLSTNAFRMESNVGNGPIGLCLDPLLAHANHRCQPNAALTFEGKCATLRTLTPITQNQQIFISYIDETQRGEARVAALKETWFFECDCPSCTSDKFPSVYHHFLDVPSISTLNFDAVAPYSETNSFAKARVLDDTPANIMHLYSSLHVIRHIEHFNTHPPKALAKADVGIRLSACIANVSSLHNLIITKNYAQQPLPLILNQIYLLYLEKADYMSALLILIFLIIHTDPYNHKSPYHPQRATRLLALHRLLKLDLFDQETIQQFSARHSVPIDGLGKIDWVSTSRLVAYVLREVGLKCWGKETVVMRDVERDIGDMEQTLQGRSSSQEQDPVGLCLRAWDMNKRRTEGYSEMGAVYAKELGNSLRRIAGYVWSVVGLKIEDADTEDM